MSTISVNGLMKDADVKNEITNMIKNGSCQVSVGGQVVQNPVLGQPTVVSLMPIQNSDGDYQFFGEAMMQESSGVTSPHSIDGIANVSTTANIQVNNPISLLKK